MHLELFYVAEQQQLTGMLMACPSLKVHQENTCGLMPMEQQKKILMNRIAVHVQDPILITQAMYQTLLVAITIVKVGFQRVFKLELWHGMILYGMVSPV